MPRRLGGGFFFFFAFLWVLCGKGFSLDRSAFVFARYDLEVRVDPAGHALAVRGKVLVRNVSRQAQRDVALQISSSLEWRLIQLDGKALQYVADAYTSDIDHTGVLNEAVVTLPYSVPPQGTVELEVGYDGTITRDATRLTRAGTPQDTALHNDWDEIGEPITAVRGVGYVAWYPVSMAAASVSQGTLFSELAAWKDSQRASAMNVNFCWVSESDQLAVVANGQLRNVTRNTLGAGEEDTETHTGCSRYQFAALGGTVPTFAIAGFATLDRPQINVYHLAEDSAGAQEYALDAEKVAVFVNSWFGRPKQKVQVIELPQKGDAPFESGPVLFTSFGTVRPLVEMRMAHQLVHASFHSPRRWIDEGLAYFTEALWREQQDGRASALAFMDSFLPPLQAAEAPPATHAAEGAAATNAPASNHQSETSNSLINTDDEILYRIKAMFVWWMLRDLAGDDALRAAIREYRPAADTTTSYLPNLVQRQTKRDLAWFFDDWVYRDRGLPDLRVVSAFPRATLAGAYVVTVTVENSGNAGAEAQVSLASEAGERGQPLLVPARGQAVARIQFPATPASATVNDGSVPESDMKNNSLKIAVPAAPQEP